MRFRYLTATVLMIANKGTFSYQPIRRTRIYHTPAFPTRQKFIIYRISVQIPELKYLYLHSEIH